MDICWVAFEAPDVASFRFRIEKPFELLRESFECGLVNPKFFDGQLPKARVYVFHKHFAFDFEYNLALRVKQANPEAKIVFDICDDHFDKEMGYHYKRMSELADVLTTTNSRFKERIKEVTGKEAFVCFDPVNSAFGMFKHLCLDLSVTYDKRDVNPVWFGHKSNLPYFIAITKSWISDETDNLTIFTNGNFNDQRFGLGDFILTQLKYFPGRVEQSLNQFNIAILPQDDSKNETRFKSPNRVLDALNAGLSVVTNSEEVYGEFKDFIYLDKDLCKAFQNCKNATDYERETKVIQGQNYIKQHYSDKVLKDQWTKVFQPLLLLNQ